MVSSRIMVSPDSSTRRSLSSRPTTSRLRAPDRLQPCRVRHKDAAVAVLGEDEVGRARGDRVEKSVALAQRGRGSFQRSSTAHDALVELGVGVAHRALGLALGRGFAQHEHRAGEAVGRVHDGRGVDVHRMHATVARADRRLAVRSGRGFRLERGFERIGERRAATLIEELEQVVDRPPWRPPRRAIR